MTGRSFLQHWALILLPHALYKTYPDVLNEMLQTIGAQLREVFYEGMEIGGPGGSTYCAAVVRGKGDLKWFCKVGSFIRSFKHKRFVQDQPLPRVFSWRTRGAF